MPAAAGAIRCTSTAPSRSPRPRALQAIEIEDQLLPRRVEHHVGIDHLVPTEFIVEEDQGGGGGPHRSRPAHRRPHQCASGSAASTRRCAAARLAEGRRRHGVLLHAQAGGDAQGRRAGAAAADDVRAAGRLCHLRPVAGRMRRARLSAGRLVGHRVRRHGQGGAPVLRVLAQDKMDPFLGAGGAEQGNEGRAGRPAGSIACWRSSVAP